MFAWFASLRQLFLERDVLSSPALRRFLAAAVLLLATVAGASWRVPLPGSPVPLTLQTFFVLAGAALLGWRDSSRAQAVYLVCGSCGLPFFAGGPIFWSATGGYLVGFILASALIGWLLPSHALHRTGRILLALVLGEAVILAAGVLWLAGALHLALPYAWKAGALVFLPGDALKIAAAAAVVRILGAPCRRVIAR